MAFSPNSAFMYAVAALVDFFYILRLFEKNKSGPNASTARFSQVARAKAPNTSIFRALRLFQSTRNKRIIPAFALRSKRKRSFSSVFLTKKMKKTIKANKTQPLFLAQLTQTT